MIFRSPLLRTPVTTTSGRRRLSALLAVATVALVAVTAPSEQAQAQRRAQTSRNAAAAAPATSYHGQVVADIIAQVNDQVISNYDYSHALQELDQQAKQQNMSDSRIEQQKHDLLRDLIDNQLLLSKGKQLGITGEAETVRQLDELRKQNHLPTMEALQEAAAKQGVNFADFKASIRNRVITSQVIRQEVGSRINITQAEEKQYYDNHKDQFTTPEEVKLSEILVGAPDENNAAQVAKAKTKADELEAELKSGKDFAALAKADSGGSTASQGGVLGDFQRGRGQLAEVLEDAVFPLQAGAYTAPIRTKQGYIILKVDDHTAAGAQPYSQVQNQVEEAVGMQKMQPALRRYLTRLRSEAYIEVRPGYVDGGAAKDETRPIYSAYQPPQKKKKKAKEVRTRYGLRGRTRGESIRMARAKKEKSPPANAPSLAAARNGTARNTEVAAGQTGTMKAGKREKVRFGQAPRETLPAAATTEQDAGAGAANGNTSAVEGSTMAEGNVPNAHYESGANATVEQPRTQEVKTRYSARAFETKAQKKARIAKENYNPYPAPPPTSQEIASKKVQAQPLGLEGDTSKPKPKPKPTTKTRYSSEAFKKSNTTQPPAATAQPDQEPSPEKSPGTNPPVATQGAGNPLGSTTQAPATPAQPPQ